MTSALRSVSWRLVALYYGVALAVALPFNAGWTTAWTRASFPGTPLALWPFLPAALGPALAAFLARRAFPAPGATMSLFGTSPARSLAVAAVPILAFGALDTRTGLLAAVAVVYATGEELGWRGLLTDALSPLSFAPKALVTAVLWWSWHCRFATAFDLLAFPLILVASSFLLGHAARITGSVLVPGAMHALVTLLSASGPPSRSRLLAAAATVAAWAALGQLWPHPRPVPAPSPE